MRLSIGKTRKDIAWKVVDLTWDELCDRLSKTLTTAETVAEYKRMTKDEKSDRKDVGGFVGGVIEGGRRLKDRVTSRTLVTLDADYAKENLWESIEVLCDYAVCVYTTHSHQPKAPRYRIIVPLDREVSPEEYEPIARRVAAELGIEQFDVSTYEVNRLMHWPSTPKDGEFIFRRQDGDALRADEYLASYNDWRDAAEWPLAASESAVKTKQAKAQGKPEDKAGLVGLFCRTYDIHAVIAAYLADEYSICDDGERYTYIKGSTYAGAVTYDSGRFLFSHHATDPAHGVLCNAFDLVRLHRFADMDSEAAPDTPVNKLPSYAAMCDLVRADERVKQTAVAERLEGAKEVFKAPVEEPEEDELDWTKKLKLNKSGGVEATTENIHLILENDPRVSGALARNDFTNRLCIIADTPWRKCEDKVNGVAWTDMDDSALRHYIETLYGISNQTKIADALNVSMLSHAFHPVRSYLQGLEWDEVPRGERLFVNYLGAEDNLYVRTVTRKWLTAAVARIMRPGVKFDNMIVLVGAQGIGKSYLGNRLGRGWFSDTFSTLSGKEAFEQLKGSWIIEMGELSVMKKAEVESVKLFISKQEDNYRAAYGRHAQVNKRQCVFYGTTNDDSFLRDRTGNRRFWPVGCDARRRSGDVFRLTDGEVDQIWAEAVSWFKGGEGLYLPSEVAALAAEEQDKYMLYDPRVSEVEDYLNLPLPISWDALDKTARRNYILGYTPLEDGAQTMTRNTVSAVEIAYELFGKESIEPWLAKDIHGLMLSIKGWKKTGRRQRTVYGQQPIYERTEEST